MIKVLTMVSMVSMVLLPATVIVSIFGTNLTASVRTIPLNTPVGLLVMFLCILLVSGRTLLAFRRQGWLQRLSLS